MSVCRNKVENKSKKLKKRRIGTIVYVHTVRQNSSSCNTRYVSSTRWMGMVAIVVVMERWCLPEVTRDYYLSSIYQRFRVCSTIFEYDRARGTCPAPPPPLCPAQSLSQKKTETNIYLISTSGTEQVRFSFANPMDVRLLSSQRRLMFLINCNDHQLPRINAFLIKIIICLS